LSVEGKENISPGPKGVSDRKASTSNSTSTHAKATQSTLGNFFNLPNPKKRPLHPGTTISATSSNINDAQPSSKKSKAVDQRDGKNKDRSKDSFTQMCLTHLPLLHTCSQCLMSYVRGGEDEGLHEKHHARVTRGIIWEGLGRRVMPKEKGKRAVANESFGCGWRVVRENVSFGPSAGPGNGVGREKGKGKGRIVVADGSFGGTRVSFPSSPLPRSSEILIRVAGRYPENSRYGPFLSSTPYANIGPMQDLPIHHLLPCTL
jgi:N-acetyltransferase